MNLAYLAIDVLLEQATLIEDQIDAARLANTISFVAKAGPGTDPTVLGQQQGYLLKHLQPRLGTAKARAQAAGLNPGALEQRFATPANLQQVAQTHLRKWPQGSPNPAKSISAVAGYNLSNHLIQLSGQNQQQDAQVHQQLGNEVSKYKSVAAKALQVANDVVERTQKRRR